MVTIEPLGCLDRGLRMVAGGACSDTSDGRARDLKGKPIFLRGIGEYHAHEHLMCAPSLTEFGATESGRIAYEMAGLGPRDIDVAELYDCFTIVPIIELEELGFCERGEGGSFFADGHARIGGKLPVHTHGR